MSVVLTLVSGVTTNGDIKNMNLNTNYVVSDVRVFMSELLGFRDDGVGESVTIYTYVSSDGGGGLMNLILEST